MVDLSTFITVMISLVTFIIIIGGAGLVTKTTLQNKVTELEKDIVDIKASSAATETKLRTELTALRVEIKTDVTKIIDSRHLDTIQFTDALSKFNNILNDFKISMEGTKYTLQHINSTLENIDKRLDLYDKRLIKVENGGIKNN